MTIVVCICLILNCGDLLLKQKNTCVCVCSILDCGDLLLKQKKHVCVSLLNLENPLTNSKKVAKGLCISNLNNREKVAKPRKLTTTLIGTSPFVSAVAKGLCFFRPSFFSGVTTFSCPFSLLFPFIYPIIYIFFLEKNILLSKTKS